MSFYEETTGLPKDEISASSVFLLMAFKRQEGVMVKLKGIVPMIFCIMVLLVSAQNLYAEPGASLEVSGIFTDINTGYEYEVEFGAEEFTDWAGAGCTYLLLRGPYEQHDIRNIRACSTHGGPAGEDVFPFYYIECGINCRQSVSINSCRAEVELHGFLHSDHPFVTYNGSTTFDVKLSKTENGWLIEIEMFTPKEKIKLKGILVGDVILSTC
jgi:hypothetical protein